MKDDNNIKPTPDSPGAPSASLASACYAMEPAWLTEWQDNLPEEALTLGGALDWASNNCECDPSHRYEVLGQNGEIFCFRCFVLKSIWHLTNNAYESGYEQAEKDIEDGLGSDKKYSLRQLHAAWGAGRYAAEQGNKSNGA